MSCAQKAGISPCLSEVGSWTTVTSLHLLSVKTDCSHQLLHSKIFSSDLSLLTGSRNKGFEFSALCRNAGVRSESQCFARQFSSPQSVFIQVGQNHPYTTHICFVFGYMVPLCQLQQVFHFLLFNSTPTKQTGDWDFFFKKKQGGE